MYTNPRNTEIEGLKFVEIFPRSMFPEELAKQSGGNRVPPSRWRYVIRVSAMLQYCVLFEAAHWYAVVQERNVIEGARAKGMQFLHFGSLVLLHVVIRGSKQLKNWPAGNRSRRVWPRLMAAFVDSIPHCLSTVDPMLHPRTSFVCFIVYA